MLDKDPYSYICIQYIWVPMLSVWAAIVSFHSRVAKGETRWLNFMELFGEILTSGFVGIMTFIVCEASGISHIWSSFFVGIFSHMGTKAINILVKIAIRFFNSMAGK